MPALTELGKGGKMLGMNSSVECFSKKNSSRTGWVNQAHFNSKPRRGSNFVIHQNRITFQWRLFTSWNNKMDGCEKNYLSYDCVSQSKRSPSIFLIRGKKILVWRVCLLKAEKEGPPVFSYLKMKSFFIRPSLILSFFTVFSSLS